MIEHVIDRYIPNTMFPLPPLSHTQPQTPILIPFPIPHSHSPFRHRPNPNSIPTRTNDIFCGGGFIVGDEVASKVPTEPADEQVDLGEELGARFLIHGGFVDELRHRDCEETLGFFRCVELGEEEGREGYHDKVGERNKREDKPTKESTEMFGTVDVSNGLALPFPTALFHGLPGLEILLALEPVQQDASQGLFEILLHPRHHLFEQVGLRGSRRAQSLGFVEVGRQDLVGGMERRERDESELAGDVFPVIDQKGLQVVGKFDDGRGLRVNRFFLHG